MNTKRRNYLKNFNQNSHEMQAGKEGSARKVITDFIFSAGEAASGSG